MPVDEMRLREEFDCRESYKDLQEEYRDKVLKILKRLRSPKHVRAILEPGGVSHRFLRPTLEWLQKRGYVEEERVGKKRIFRRTNEGNNAEIYLSAPPYESIRFRVDGEPAREIELWIEDNDGDPVRLGAEKLSILVRTFVTGERSPIGMVDAMGEGEKLKISQELLPGSHPVAELYSEMLRFYLERATGKLPSEKVGHRSPALELTPLEHAYVRRVLSGECILPAAFSAHDPILSKAAERYRRYWREVLDEDLTLEGIIERHVSKPIVDALKNRSCRGWVQRRLKENPDFFMPRRFWPFLGFKGAPLAETIEASPPYNAILESPEFAGILPELLDSFSFAAEASAVEKLGGMIPVSGWTDYLRVLAYATFYGEDEERVTKKIERGQKGHIRLKRWEDVVRTAFLEFRRVLRRHQRAKNFYEAWRVLRESTLGEERYENLEFFEPLNEGLVRYIEEGCATDLARLYARLLMGEVKPEEVKKAVRSGEYDLSEAK